jgi:hypothetical protein
MPAALNNGRNVAKIAYDRQTFLRPARAGIEVCLAEMIEEMTKAEWTSFGNMEKKRRERA